MINSSIMAQTEPKYEEVALINRINISDLFHFRILIRKSRIDGHTEFNMKLKLR